MRIRLIDPSRYAGDGSILKLKQLLFPPITLPLLASLAPPDAEIGITSEHFDDIDFDEETDIVGITAYSSRILRAYKIADEFRKRGRYVVMGGIHVSMEPEEAMAHADTVITGEAEETWPEFLDDFRNGRPGHIYRAAQRPALNDLPVPRFSLVDKSKYLCFRTNGIYRLLPTPLIPVQTARGCPHGCHYCSVTVFSGGEYRARPIPDVIAEIRTLGAKGCIFLDDNIFADASRAEELFEALIPLKIPWLGQGTMLAARNRGLIRLARKSGCVALLLGLESISRGSISELGKKINKVSEYEGALKAYSQEGISVMASMIFGADGETPEVFKDAYKFLVKNRVAYTLWHPLIPLPGTVLYKRLEGQNRLNGTKWWLDPKGGKDYLSGKFEMDMDEGVFRDTFIKYYRAFYSLISIIKRTLFPVQERFLPKILFNLLLRKRVKLAISLIET